MISARVRPDADLDDVVLTVSGVPARTRWRVTGTAGEWEWVAGASTSEGRPQYFADPLAPVGLPATYRLSFDGTTAGPVTRRSTLRRDWVTDTDGRVAVPFMRAVEHEVSISSNVYLYRVKGRARPMVAVDDVASIGSEQLAVRTDGLDKTTLRNLIIANRPLVVLHNRDACPLPGCDIAPAQRVITDTSRGSLTRRLDEAERLWVIDVQEIDTPFGDLAPAATWGEVAEHFTTWQDVRSRAGTWGALAEGAWLAGGAPGAP